MGWYNIKKTIRITLGIIDRILYVLITDDGNNKIVYRLSIIVNTDNKIEGIKNSIKLLEFKYGTKLESIFLDVDKRKILIADEGKYLIYILIGIQIKL
jgi:hypothetical protein